MKAAAVAAAALVLLAATGGGAFLLIHDAAPGTTTTTTTTTTITVDDVAIAIAKRLATGLKTPLSELQAECVARSFLAVVGRPALAGLAASPSPLGQIDLRQRDAITRGIVVCVPPETAALLLAPKPLTPPP
ncbi:MAG: hypothetical protein EXQ71_07850 [Acidimicrobiia bacterium]|nr:hypothetical protein [Acidimicrobiia bacterium]